MEAENEGKFTYQQIYGYIKHGKYPETVQKDDKLALWKQSKFFQAQEMHLYYIGGIFYVVVGLVIDRSLPKLAKDR